MKKFLLFLYGIVIYFLCYGNDCYEQYICMNPNWLENQQIHFIEKATSESFKNKTKINQALSFYFDISESEIEHIFRKNNIHNSVITCDDNLLNEFLLESGLSFYKSLSEMQTSIVSYKREDFLGIPLSIDGKFEDKLLFSKVSSDSIVTSIKKNKRYSCDYLFRYISLYYDNVEIRKTIIINNTIFYIDQNNIHEPLFIKSPSESYYKNSLGKFYCTGKKNNISFLDCNYSEIYEYFYINEHTVFIVWIDDNFRLIRIGDFTSTFNGYYLKI